MSSSKMLIDASHPEETRVVVLKGNRVEEFDFESATKKQLRGNIYLAKVTRVEPSLQAAFIEYGGNRHGFLAFAEIHPDYYQIPHADRLALLEEEARAHRDEDDEVRGTEGRNGENRSNDDRGGERGARGERNRGERSERGERGHRRSRRHRRDAGTSALDRRGRPDDAISEPVPEAEPLSNAIGFDGEGQVSATTEDTGAVGGVDDGSSTAAGFGTDPMSDGPIEALSDAEAPSADEAEPLGEDSRGAAVHTADAPGDQIDVLPSAEDAAASDGGVEPAVPHASEVDDRPHVSAAALDGESVAEPDAPNGRTEPENDVDAASEPEGKSESVEQIGGDALEEMAPRPARLRRHYKIQEVIKRRQILLIQVVKEERGNKGAALTTYLSLAGRYSVLMPNTARGGGISRKITDGEDRKRLKAIAQELDVPEGMGVILRTAGAARSNQEVRRDFEYLLRMWESVRELTLKSTAPTLVYEEGSLIKRSIRDLYSKDVEEIVVAGDDGFAEARDFMGMLMPHNVKSVQLYSDAQPIFAKSGVEAQLDAMFSNHVTLKSGGYLVINQTEALVAIDVNSGRSTREHNIEDTALRTNLEAADEVARQLRLRDLAGLIVIDFIDMDEGRNNRAVERRIKDALKNDRARIQIGHISHFGLMEMSRQRIRTGVLEGSTIVCPHCAGAGTVRSTASIALHVLRLAEDALLRDASHDIIVRSRTEVALYVLNQKRPKLIELERRFGVSITVVADATLTGMVYHAIERGEPAMSAVVPEPRRDLVRVDSIAPIFDPGSDDDGDETADGEEEAEGDGSASAELGDGGRRRKRRRRRRGRDRETAGDVAAEGPQPPDDGMAVMAEIGGDMPAGTPTNESSSAEAAIAAGDTVLEAAVPRTRDNVPPPEPDSEVGGIPGPTEEVPDAPPRRRRSRRTPVQAETETTPVGGDAAADVDAAPARRRRRPAKPRAAEIEVAEIASKASPSDDRTIDAVRPAADRAVGADTVEHHAPSTAPEEPEPLARERPATTALPEEAPALPEEAPDPDRPKRSGWWQRAKASFGS